MLGIKPNVGQWSNHLKAIILSTTTLSLGALNLGTVSVMALSLGACGAKQDASTAHNHDTHSHEPPTISMLSAQMAQIASTRKKPLPKGMVAAANPHAVDAGVAALQAGGSAIDAALAVQTVLGLVEPQSSGIAGGAFLIYYEAKTGLVHFYNGRETAPKNIDENLFKTPDGKPMRFPHRVVSGLSTGVPGAIAMLNMAHGEHGKIEWAKGFDHGIKLAEDGFAVSPRLAFITDYAQKWGIKNQAATRNYFFPDGEPLKVGFIRDNQPYAKSLRAIAADPKALYKGPLAQSIIDAVHEAPRPGILAMSDFTDYRPQKGLALCSTYREFYVCGPQAPSSGGIAVQSILGQLENFDMSGFGPSLSGWHAFAEASKMAYADRDLYVADPDFVEVPTRPMLDPKYLKSRAGLINMDKAIENISAGDPVNFRPGKDATPDQKGTSHLSIVDQWGNVVSMTTTVESVFGSQRMAGGFLLNNQLTDFSARSHDDEGKPIANRAQAGKRPRSSMAPHIVFDKNGQFLFATGSPGGSSIIAYTAKTIIAMIDWGMSPQEAAALVNFIARNGSVRLEEAKLSPQIISGLETLGHKVVRSKGEMSGIHIIRKNADGQYEGGVDPRREGKAVSHH